MIFTWLCLLNLFIKIDFLLNQIIIEIITHVKLTEYNNKKKYARSNILEILSKNKYFLFLKNTFNLYKTTKKYRRIRIISPKVK